MTFNHEGNTANANALSKIASPGALRGRGAARLVIYTVDYASLRASGFAGPNLDTIVSSIVADDEADLIKGYRQPTNHEDRDSNLPVAPDNNVVYREYFVSKNNFKWPGFPRLVADLHNRRLFLTPTHYDVWLPVPSAAKALSTASAATGAGLRSPFFLLTSVNTTNNLFD